MNAMAAIHSEEMQIAIAEFGARLRDPWWRLTGGLLYKITDKQGEIRPFTPNDQQLYLLRNLAPRMTIPKSRQLGITTLGCLYLLDYGTDRAKYLDAFFANVAWREVDRRLGEAR